MNPTRTESLIGVPMGTVDFDHEVAYPTKTGRRWGLDHAFRGDYTVDVSDAIQPLAIDELGKTTAWVRVYRADRPGSGFVQLWGLGATLDRLPAVRAAAEYGLLRRADSSRGQDQRGQSRLNSRSWQCRVPGIQTTLTPLIHTSDQ